MHRTLVTQQRRALQAADLQAHNVLERHYFRMMRSDCRVTSVEESAESGS